MFRAGNRAVCVSPICQHGLLFIGVYVPSRHRMLFLPDKCQVLKVILPVPLWRLPNNLFSLAMGSCQAFFIHAHLSLPNVGNTGTVQLLPASFISFAQLWLQNFWFCFGLLFSVVWLVCWWIFLCYSGLKKYKLYKVYKIFKVFSFKF